MELLKRALLLGCLLPGLWLLRLTPLEPFITIAPVERPRAPESPQEMPIVASGPAWSALLHDIDTLEDEREPPELRWRKSSDSPRHGSKAPSIFFRRDDEPVRTIQDRLTARGALLVNAEGDRYYRVDRRAWTREDFRPPAGFVGSPAPPASLLYPFQVVGLALILAGFGLFILLPRGTSDTTAPEVILLVATAALFAGPLFLVGGSVQALIRWPWLTIPSWVLAGVAMHFFAAPQQNVRLYLLTGPEGSAEETVNTVPFPQFARLGLVFLALALGPAAVLIACSMALWNR
jgi:hypothetical protein